MILGRQGFETAVKGKNGFVCIVGRSWTSAPDADFWNPKVRVPMCVNAAAARSYLLHFSKLTDMGLAGRTPAQMNEAISAAIARKELPPSVQTVCNRTLYGASLSAPYEQVLLCLGISVERNDLSSHIAVILGKSELSRRQLPGDQRLPLDLSLHDEGRRILREYEAWKHKAQKCGNGAFGFVCCL
jgi:hypothetical protein